ncbi:MAG: hypothetical protein UT45_C0001G0114 [Candidatus Daviesbacteria bacterium GW2011_GWA2_39_33]|nr:MAG: hypothetical protein UT45_C0001G0114 [Candidatus Daviesbacteria bacterium GW2011_GWA2_39_33]
MHMKQNKPHMSDQEQNSHNEDKNDSSQSSETQVWDKVDAVFVAARNALYQGQSNFLEVLDSLIATLQDMRENEVRPLGGLGTAESKMKIQEPSESEEEIPEDQNT